ncbi:MAG: 50S ribosomal protein L25 [Chloroflexi bacterium]|nr:50S ribosomal protein L25 [Chloroflexota bacterium]
MEKIVINAAKRDVIGKQVRALRRAGKLPGVLYGHGIESMPIMLDLRETSRTLENATSSSLFTVKVDGKEYPALVREKQWDFIRRTLLHVDFQVVSMTEKIAAKVRIELVGESLAVKEYGAVLVTGLTELEVEALPTDLPERITVDISGLVEVGDGIHVSDMVVDSAKIKILDDPSTMIAFATAAAKEEEEEVVAEELLEGEVEGEEPEVIERGKAEEEGGEE